MHMKNDPSPESKVSERGTHEADDAKTSPRKPSPYIFMSAGIEFTAVTSALAGIGWWLDSKWGTDPYLMIVGLAMGLIGGTYKLWRLGRIFFR